METKELEIINNHLRTAYNILRVNHDKHAYEVETVIKSIESEIWSRDMWPDEYPVRQSVHSGAL